VGEGDAEGDVTADGEAEGTADFDGGGGVDATGVDGLGVAVGPTADWRGVGVGIETHAATITSTAIDTATERTCRSYGAVVCVP